ncbi:hypothetical protein HD806DRAFT_11247 [Xylariaceae sp. AK1471]|nr:hypothetical protein HD806DRAFT_11247 [Xylariaceae sp. AK1471]
MTSMFRNGGHNLITVSQLDMDAYHLTLGRHLLYVYLPGDPQTRSMDSAAVTEQEKYRAYYQSPALPLCIEPKVCAVVSVPAEQHSYRYNGPPLTPDITVGLFWLGVGW